MSSLSANICRRGWMLFISNTRAFLHNKEVNGIRALTTDAAPSMRAVVVKDKKMAIDEVPCPEPGPKDVLLKVSSTAVNRADTLQKRGLYPPPAGESDILGLEAMGEVASVGIDCVKGFRVGDRVMGILGGGGYAEFVSAHEAHFMKVPDHMHDTHAAAIPEAWLTAYQLMKMLTNCQSGEKVLVHAAASGVGTAAVQLAKHFGMVCYATVGSKRKADLVESLGADVVINYKEENFEDVILKHSGVQGVDVILDCIGGSYVNRNLRVLAPDGRWALYGFLGGSKVEEKFLLKLFAKRAQLFATTLRTRPIKYKDLLVQSFANEILPLFGTGKMKPVIDSVYAWSDVNDAHQRMEANENIGKILLNVV